MTAQAMLFHIWAGWTAGEEDFIVFSNTSQAPVPEVVVTVTVHVQYDHGTEATVLGGRELMGSPSSLPPGTPRSRRI